MTRLPTVMITEAPAGVPATVLGRLHTLDLSTVVYSPSPERRNKAGVAFETLQALGKRTDVNGKSRQSTTETELLSLWLTAHRTELLIAVACQRTPVPDMLDLIEMTQIAPTSILFATDHGFADQLEPDLAPATPVRVSWPQLPPIPDPTDESRNLSEWDAEAEPVLPLVEYWTFYATAKRQMTSAQFTPVHDLYCNTLNRLTAWLSNLTTAGAD
jgi:hypothetical protein